ncbi:MAG: ABC transporter ATP-binding protein/permease [Bacilli bacterium]|nr:ABC transporter ATP-binding protein/permease [Bacilli bacterium]
MKMWQRIKLILKSVREYKKFALITPLFMVGEAALECLLPFIMSVLIDDIGKIEKPIDIMEKYFTNFIFPISIFWIIIILIGFSILSLICGILGGRFAARASIGMGANLRSDLYKKIQSFSFNNIDKFHSSSLITRMTTDVNNVQMAFQMCIRIVIRAPLMMIFSAIMAFIAGGHMAWIFIGLIPLVGFALFLIIRFAMKIFMRVFKRYDKLNESVQENVSGVRVVKSFVREDFEKEKFARASDGMTGDFIKAEKIVALHNPVINTGIHLSNILVVGIGSYIICTTLPLVPVTTNADGETVIEFGQLSIGQMSSLLTYGIQILSSVMMISMILIMLVMSIESMKRIAEVLEEVPSIQNPENPITEVKNGEVVFKNVNFKYFENAEKNTLENLNLTIKSGQFIGVLGSTGSGKTSLVNLISRLYDVTDGSVTVAGHDVREYDLVTLRDAVSVVLQKNVLFSGTIASNLRWGNKEATEEEMWAALKIAQADEIVNGKEQKLESVVEQGGANFSGGQKQRICIARALLKNPKILILDDSTSAVDTKTDRLIRKGLKESLPEMTKIVIAQRISSIENADQIIIMDDGKINAIGTHEELLKSNKIYQEVYYTQNAIGGNK